MLGIVTIVTDPPTGDEFRTQFVAPAPATLLFPDCCLVEVMVLYSTAWRPLASPARVDAGDQVRVTQLVLDDVAPTIDMEKV